MKSQSVRDNRPVLGAVLKVFCSPTGTGGNLLGVVLPDAAERVDDRAEFASATGYSGVLFVESISDGVVQIFGRDGREMAFAGHPLVGAGWLLPRLGGGGVLLRPAAGDVPTWSDPSGNHWISAPPHWGPEVTLIEYGAPDDVTALTGAPDGLPFVYCWAWQDRSVGRVRARAFAPGYGVPEDEATGCAAIRLAAVLGRPITIDQGTGSILFARPGFEGHIELGGRVVRC